VVSQAAPATVPTVQRAASASIADAPQASYVAGRVGGGGRNVASAGARVQRNAGMAPRRTASGRSSLPMVQVKMEGAQAVVQNQAVVDQVREQIANEAAASSDAEQIAALTSLSAENERLRAELEAARAAVPVTVTPETEPQD
jgi:hypothetical protein